MPIAVKLDELGKPAWIALVVLGFVVWWPAGLAILAFTIWSGRMGCWKHRGYGRSPEAGERMRGSGASNTTGTSGDSTGRSSR